MRIEGIKCRKIMACPGSWAVVAEAAVVLDDGNVVYVTAQEYDGVELTVGKQSVYDYLADNGSEPAEEFTEEYLKWKDARESAYDDVFEKLRKVMKMLG